MALVVDADGDQHARVLDGPSPAALVPYPVQEHVRVFVFQGSFPPLVDASVDRLQLAAQRLQGHMTAPERLADVVDPARRDAFRIHLDQGLVDALLPAPAAVDDLRV